MFVEMLVPRLQEKKKKRATYYPKNTLTDLLHGYVAMKPWRNIQLGKTAVCIVDLN